MQTNQTGRFAYKTIAFLTNDHFFTLEKFVVIKLFNDRVQLTQFNVNDKYIICYCLLVYALFRLF